MKYVAYVFEPKYSFMSVKSGLQRSYQTFHHIEYQIHFKI